MTTSTTRMDSDLLERARRVLPGITQTYSKAPDQHVEGVYPVFLERGDGCTVTDLDGNGDTGCGNASSRIGMDTLSPYTDELEA